jgi:cytidylate kinase
LLLHFTNEEEFLGRVVVTIDGPSGSGKTTTARRLAARLGLRHVDTGAMYRAITLSAMERDADLSDGEVLGALAATVGLRMEPGGGEVATRVFLGERDVSSDIRAPAVTAAVSQVSAHPPVRRAMVRVQRRLAARGGVVIEGRDIGSVVLPGADVKIYLVAATRVRAQRRVRDLEALGHNAMPRWRRWSVTWSGATRMTPGGKRVHWCGRWARGWSTPPKSPSRLRSTPSLTLPGAWRANGWP